MGLEPSNEELPAGQEQCRLDGLTEEQQKQFQEFLDQLAGPTKEEADKRFEKEILSFAEAANAGKDEEAREAALKAFMIAGADVMMHPTPDVQLAMEADACAKVGDWAGAEAALRKRLELDEKSGNLALVAKVHFDLSRLFQLTGRRDEAWSQACVATETARRADVAPLTADVLANEAVLALERNQIPRALAAASEAVSLIKPERIYDLARGRALTARAECLLANGEVTQAERDLESAWEFFGTSLFGGIASGPSAARARWWEVQAEFRLRNGNLAEAINALRQATELRRKTGDGCCGPNPYALVARAKGLERFTEISRQAGDAEAAGDSLNEARALREQARLPLSGVPSG